MKERNYKYTKIIILFLVSTMFFFSRHNPLNETVYADMITTDIVVGSDLEVHDKNESQEEFEENSSLITQDGEDIDEKESQEESQNNGDDGNQEEETQEDTDPDKFEVIEEEILAEKDSSTSKEVDDKLNSRALQSNEVFVSSYEELKTQIESNGSSYKYDTFYLSQDIVANAEGISVPAGFSFTIDGTNPETSERFSLIQYESEDATKTINYNYGTTALFTVKNIDIVGKNSKGVVSSSGGATIIYRNINYVGPSLTYASNGKVTLEDSNLEIKNSESFSDISALETPILEISGVNEINLKDGATLVKSNSEFINNGTVIINASDQTVEVLKTSNFENSGTLTIDVSGQVDTSLTDSVIRTNNFNNSGKIVVTSNTRLEDVFVIVNPFTMTGTIIVEAHEVMDDIIRQSFLQTTDTSTMSGEFYLKVNYLGESIISSSALTLSLLSLNAEIGSHGKESLIYVATDFISYNSDLSIKITDHNKQESKAMIKTVNQFFFENTEVNIDNEHNDYFTIFEASRWHYFYVDDDSYGGMSIRNGSKDPSFIITSDGWLIAHQMNHWSEIPDLDAYPEGDRFGASGHFMVKRSSFISVQFSSSKTNTNVTNGRETDFDNTKDFKAHGQAAYGIGRIYLDVEKNEDNSKKLRAKTNANSWVQIQTEPLFNTFADNNGIVDADVPFNIKNDTYTITTFGGYLFDTKTIEYDVDGVLEFEQYPSQIDFGTVELLENQKMYPRKTSNQLVIYDGRKNKTGWKLSVYIKQDLFVSGIENSGISNAFAYDNQMKRLSNSPLVVYEMTGSNYNTEHVITWAEDSGLQLYIDNIYDVRLNHNYRAELVWILEEL